MLYSPYIMDWHEVGKRLQQARIKSGFAKPIDAIRRFGWPRDSYYKRESGTRKIMPEELSTYAAAYGVSVIWLMHGISPQSNHNAQNIPIKPLNNLDRHEIPLLGSDTLGQLDNLIKGGTIVSDKKVAVPEFIKTGIRAIAYLIPDNDLSMLGERGDTFPPGTMLIIDPDKEIIPGNYILALPDNFELPVLRRYEAIRSPSPKTPFTLSALNPAYQPIVVNSSESCRIIGRLVMGLRAG